MKEGWEIKKLGEVCITGSGGTPLKSHKEYYEGGTIPWIQSGEVRQAEICEANNFITDKGLKNSSARIFPKNTVLVAMYGATAGQVGILKFEACTNQAVCGILPNKYLLPEFIYYYFLYIKDALISQAIGNAQPNISQIKIRETNIPFPSLPEQHRIVAILDQAFAAIDKAKANAEKNLKNARELFESYLSEVFRVKGEGWMALRLGDICDIIGGGTPSKSNSKFYSGDIPWATVRDMKNGLLTETH
jgi:type I restriction enzyme S subunit